MELSAGSPSMAEPSLALSSEAAQEAAAYSEDNDLSYESVLWAFAQDLKMFASPHNVELHSFRTQGARAVRAWLLHHHDPELGPVLNP